MRLKQKERTHKKKKLKHFLNELNYLTIVEDNAEFFRTMKKKRD